MALVVSLLAADFDALAGEARAQAAFADVVELRLDRVGAPGVERLAGLIRALERPVIAACNGPESYGFFAGTREQRLAVLRAAARAGASWVDVDWRLADELGPLDGAARRIVSRHESFVGADVGPGGVGRLHAQLRERALAGDLLKLVVEARSAEDGLDALAELARAPGDLIAFASGERGSFTRVLAPILGSPFTYAAPAAIPGRPPAAATAPGQLRAERLRAAWPAAGPSRATRIFGVAGSPIAHSLSPAVHGAALRAAGIDAVYVAFEPRRFAALAADERVAGLSVTAPFKADALAAAAEADGESRAIGAANTLVRGPGGWRAHNTDAPAVQAALEHAWSERAGRHGPLAAARVLVLGTGGAARAALRAARALGASAAVAGRDAAKARALAAETGAAALGWNDVAGAEYAILVHATPVGTAGDALPIPREWLRPGTLVLDAVYRPRTTALLAAAAERGCAIVRGEEWFLRQAALQFRLFTGRDPDLAAMRAAFEHDVAS